MSDSGRFVYEFGSFRADPVERRLFDNGDPVRLTPKAFETLITLLSGSGQVLKKDELIDAVWGETAVEENNLTQQIATLRRTLGKRLIVTVPGRGYSFVAPVHKVDIDPSAEVLILESTRSSFTIDLFGNGRGAWREGRLGLALAIAYIAIVSLSVLLPQAFSTPRPRTVAVMSFRTVDSHDVAVGQGIRDTLRARLGSLDDVAVRPISPEIADTDAISAGRALSADVVLTGSVQREDDRLRVVVELVDVANARIVWGATFDRTRAGVFELQDSIAAQVASALTGQRVSPS